MRAAFYRSDAPDESLATADWIDGGVIVESADASLLAGLEHSFRTVPVITDDAAFRRFGTSGAVSIAPGSLEWFRVAAQVRATVENDVAVRLEPGVTEGGFDPAAGYRSFSDAVERLTGGDGVG